MLGLDIQDGIIIIVGIAILGIWLVFYMTGKKYASYFETLNEDEFPLKDIYFIGYAILEAIKFPYRSKSIRILKKNLEIIYGEKYADYYLRVIYAQKVTLSLTVMAFGVPLYCLGDSMVLLFVMALFVWVTYYYFGTLPAEKIKERSTEMLRDFSEMVSKLALLVNAGMILREAWQKVSLAGTGELYEEMKRSVTEMNNGKSEQEAIYEFGQRCMMPESKKFSSTIVQGITKGNSELSAMLTKQSQEMWALKKQQVRRQGELAANKLMIPICITFIGILIMVVIPIFAGLGM